MNRSQADRTVIAARAAANGRTGRHGSVLPPVAPKATGPIRRSRGTRLTATQRSANGGRSLWTASPYYWTDPKWGL